MSNALVISTGTDSKDYVDQSGYGAPTGTGVSGGDLTKAQIERIRATDIDRYFAEGLDRRLLQMMKEELGQTRPTDRMPVEDSRAVMCETPEGARLVAGWERMGGFRVQLERVQDAVDSLVCGIGDDRQQRRFMYDFDKFLPEPLRYQIYMQIALGPPSFVVPATAADIKKFTVTPVGVELVQEWGSDAATNVATVWKRVAMLREAVGEVAMGDFYDWFEELPPAQIKAVTRFIAGRHERNLS